MFKGKIKLLTIFSILLLLLTLTGCGELLDEETTDFNSYLLESSGIEIEEESSSTTESVTHFIENYEIALVFDNSGSMYTGNNSQAWCRAKYAMEIFASMLNYNQRGSVPGDKLSIFPMWEVTTDGSTPAYAEGVGSTEPIEINSISDIDKIHNIFTIKAWSTPYETVQKAYEHLQKSNAPQKWMIVLTDGEFDGMSVDATGTGLASLANSDIKVQYLGIGEAASLDAYVTDYFFAKKSSSSESLKSDIIDICNHIFQRDQLPSSALNNKELKLDISMENLFVFVQGDNAKINSLKDSNGNEIEIVLDSNQRKFSELSAGNYLDQAITDTTLSGQVVTFGKCATGTYTLDYEDANSVQIFYTPNIDIALTFADANGKVLDITGRGEKLYPGEYILNYYLIDGVTKEDVTNNPLIAPVVFDGGYINSNGTTTDVENGGKVVLQPDASTFLRVDATYLNNYLITTNNRKSDYTVAINFPAIDVDLKMMQEDGWYVKSDYKNWEPIVAELTLVGNKLTDLQLGNTELKVTFEENDVPCRIEKVAGESKMLIYLGQDEAGNKQDVKADKYKVAAYAEYVNGNTGNELIGDKDSENFRIEAYPKWVIYAAIAAIIAAIIAFILWLLFHKAFPKGMQFKDDDGNLHQYTKFHKKNNNLLLGQNETIMFDAKPKTAWKDRKTKRAKIEISNVRPDLSIESFTIGSKTYYNQNNEFVDDSGNKLTSKNKFLIKATPIEWSTARRSYSGTTTFKSKGKKKRKR